MTMRVNIHKFLTNRQLHYTDSKRDARIYARPTAREKSVAKMNTPSNLYAGVFTHKADMKSTIDRIIENIHKNMKSVPPPRKSVPTIPKPIAEIPKKPTPTLKLRKRRKLKSRRRIKGGQNTRGGATVSANYLFSVPAIKATLAQKHQNMMRRGLADLTGKSFNNEKRLREVLKQKSMLQDMLMEHKKLQRDRQMMTLDLQKIRKEVDILRRKLDVSLQTINSTRTLFSSVVPKNKKGLANRVTTNNPVPRRRMLNKARDKSHSRSETPHRQGTITMKRQHVPKISKRRI